MLKEFMLKRFFIAIFISLIIFSCASAQELTQSVTLKPGFNFVSLTVSVTLTPQQFKQLSAAIEDIYLFSAAAGSFLSMSEGTLTTIAAGKGYIIKSSSGSSVTFSVPGSALSLINNIALKQGFNLVGFSKMPVSLKFSELMNAHSMIKGVYKWSAAAGTFISVVRDGSGNIVQLDGVDPSFAAGESYFINLASDTTINYDGAGIMVGGNPTTPSTGAPATIGGTLKAATASGAPGLNYAGTGEEFDVTLVDFNGDPVPAASLESGDANPKTVKDGEAYSFKTKDFTKSYKVIAKSRTTANKMLATFVGKVKESETVQNRDITPLDTAMSLIYADSTKTASAYAREEAAKKNDPTFMKKITPIVADLETKRNTTIKSVNFSDLSKLEKAYKDAVLGSASASEIAKIREGLDAYIGKLEEQLSAAEKLKEALSLVATTGRRQNETYVKESKDKLKNIIAAENLDPLKDTTNKNVYKEAKISYGLVCCDLGDIFKNKVGSQTAGAARGAKTLMAAYQTVKGKLDPNAKALYEEGYNAVKDLKFDAADKTAGLDKDAAAAILKNAAELAREDPSKLNDAKVKADSLLAKLDSEKSSSFTLPTGEVVDKNKILEDKGNAFINGGKPAESVQVFNEITDQRVKNYGLGQAYMDLNSLDNAFLTLKEVVKDIVKAQNGYEARMLIEENFDAVNEALFAFAALMDKLKKSTDSDVVKFRQKIEAMEAELAATEKVFTDSGITIRDILSGIKPTTSFYEVGSQFMEGTQDNFGDQFVDYGSHSDPSWALFEKAQNMMFEAGDLVERARNYAGQSDREKTIFKGAALAGTVESPAEGTAVKYINDAIAIFESLQADASAEAYLKSEAYYQGGMAYLSKFRALKQANIKNRDFIARALKVFFTIIEKSTSDQNYANLKWIAREMIGEAEAERNTVDGVSAGSNQLMQDGENYYGRARSFAYDGYTGEASADFETAYQKYFDAYSKLTTAEAKLKEGALFNAARALYDKFKTDPASNADDKDRAKRVLKNFMLEFANSQFVADARKMVNDLETAFDIGGEGYGGAVAGAPAPGPEFERALALMDKLRMYYGNNFSTAEIEPVVADAAAVFEAIFSAKAPPYDAKYFGTVTADAEVASLKASAKFMLAVLYMERYFMSNDKNAAYKNAALRYFNELIMSNPEEYFIFDAKNFVQELQNEGRDLPGFDRDTPVISSVKLDPPSVRLGEAETVTIGVTADIMLPSALDAGAASNSITAAEAHLYRFGSPVYSDAGQTVQVKTTLRLQNSKWTGTISVSKALLAPGPYDVVVTVSTASGNNADAWVPLSVKSQSGQAEILWVDPVTPELVKVAVSDYPEGVTNGYTDAFVSVMRYDNSGEPSNFGKLVAVSGISANIKLDRSTDENETAYVLDLNRHIGDLEPGSYMFMFKLVRYDAANPAAGLANPLFTYPYDCYIERVMPESDKNAVLTMYRSMLSHYNDTGRTPDQRISAVESMHEPAGFKYGADARAALTEFLSSVDGLKAIEECEPYLYYSPDGKVTIYSTLRIEGVYNRDVPNGVFMPDGRMLLQPGNSGMKLYDFYIGLEQSFVKLANGGWALSQDSGGSEEPKPEEPSGEVPMVEGLTYSAADKRIYWQPVYIEGSNQAFAYAIELDGALQTYRAEHAYYSVEGLASGAHSIRVSAIAVGSSPEKVGPWSQTLTFDVSATQPPAEGIPYIGQPSVGIGSFSGGIISWEAKFDSAGRPYKYQVMFNSGEPLIAETASYYYPFVSNLNPSENTVKVRAVTLDENYQVSAYGEWSPSLTFYNYSSESVYYDAPYNFRYDSADAMFKWDYMPGTIKILASYKQSGGYTVLNEVLDLMPGSSEVALADVRAKLPSDASNVVLELVAVGDNFNSSIKSDPVKMPETALIYKKAAVR